MKKLIQTIRRCQPYRKDHKIVWKIRAEIDRDNYLFNFLPAILWCPWPYRYDNECVVCLSWLNINIGIGVWTRVKQRLDGE